MHTPRGADERGPWAYAPLPAQGALDIPRRVPSSPALLSSGFLAASAPQRQHVSPSGGGGWPLGDHAPQSLQRQRSLGGLGTVQSGRSRASQLRGSPRASTTEASPERAVRYGTVLLPDTAGPPEDAHDVEKAAAAAALEERGQQRLCVHAMASAFSRRVLRTVMDTRPALAASAAWLPDDVLHVSWDATAAASLGLAGCAGGGEAFVFASTGLVALWGLTRAQDAALLRVFAPAALSPLSAAEAETDELQFRFSSAEPPSVQNDVVTIQSKGADAVAVKLAVSHALAQSTMLAHYERRVTESVRSTAHIPCDLARTGAVRMTRREILQLIGKLFSLKSEVNIVSPLLDTPEVFWTAPDALQVLYKSLCVYLELDARVAVVNARLNVVEDLLQMLQNTIYARHSQKLEMVVILLILVEVLVGCLQCAEMIGLIGHHSGR